MNEVWLMGGSGYIGQAYQRFFETRGIPFRVISRRDLNYYHLETLVDALKNARPDIVINSAGYTGKPNVDACELHKWECLSANAVLPSLLNDACEQAGVPLGHVSSGCIYSGSRPDGAGFREEDAPNFSFRSPPCSFYSGTKALAEEMLVSAKACYQWRLRIPFNNVDSARNYLSKLMRYERLLDARNSLCHLEEFVRACWECWEKRLPFGVYNMNNPGSITAREAVELIRKSGVSRKEFFFFESEDEFMQQAVQAPRSNCVLDASKILNAGVHLTEVHEAVERALGNWQKEEVL